MPVFFIYWPNHMALMQALISGTSSNRQDICRSYETYFVFISTIESLKVDRTSAVTLPEATLRVAAKGSA